MVDLKAKLAAFRVKPTPKSEGIVLPQAFIAATLKPCGVIPVGVDVLVERDCMGDYSLQWWDDKDRHTVQKVAKDSESIDITKIYDEARIALLGTVSVGDLYAEIARRKEVSN